MGDHYYIIADGATNFKRSDTYRKKITRIKYEAELKYQPFIDSETSFLKRLILKMKRIAEIKREISRLDSPGNMYGKQF